METEFESKIPMERCVAGRVYQIHSRNLSVGVYDGNGEFIGIRIKFHDRFLFTENHYDQGAPHGTVIPQKDTGISVPAGIELKETLGTKDHTTGRLLYFDRSVDQGGKGWVFADTEEPAPNARPVTISNRPLFEFLTALITPGH